MNIANYNLTSIIFYYNYLAVQPACFKAIEKFTQVSFHLQISIS